MVTLGIKPETFHVVSALPLCFVFHLLWLAFPLQSPGAIRPFCKLPNSILRGLSSWDGRALQDFVLAASAVEVASCQQRALCAWRDFWPCSCLALALTLGFPSAVPTPTSRPGYPVTGDSPKARSQEKGERERAF